MRFQRTPLCFEQRPPSARRLNAARRALERQANAMPLFAEQIRASQPTPEERVAQKDEAFRQFCQAQRDYDAQIWRRGRAVLRKLAPERRAELLALWNVSEVPARAHYFLDFLHSHGELERL